MKFNINKIVLWLNNGTPREFNFLPNKINVVTGDSTTGKSSIIKIIDYCLFASEANISHKFIGENVIWYGINFNINDKHFTIARGSTLSAQTRSNYYFSDSGDLPKIPETTIDEKKLKLIIEKEFSIDAETVFSVGSENVKLASKISFRYFFWLFCIQTQHVLPNDIVLFDKQSINRYRDALSKLKIFDLAIGANNPKNILIKNKIEDLEKAIIQVEKIKKVEETIEFKFDVLLSNLVADAKGLRLISPSLVEPESIMKEFNQLVENGPKDSSASDSEVEELKLRKTEMQIRLRNLKKYYTAYEKYKSQLQDDFDSLSPIQYIINNYDKISINNSTIKLIETMGRQFDEIKDALKNKKGLPFSIDLTEKIKETENEIKNIDDSIANYPTEISIQNEKQKYMFIGYLKSKLEDFKNNFKTEEYSQKIENFQQTIRELEEKLEDPIENKGVIIDILNSLIDANLEILKLDDYTDCTAFYNDTEKRLDLIDKQKMLKHSMPQISSASSCMYLHIAFFIGLHELAIKKNIPYIPSFLILDQISTPYYENVKKAKGIINTNEIKIEDFNSDDRKKLNRALGFIDGFLTKVVTDINKDFQIILIEHIPEKLWIEEKFTNFHLVDKEFREGNKLINN